MSNPTKRRRLVGAAALLVLASGMACSAPAATPDPAPAPATEPAPAAPAPAPAPAQTPPPAPSQPIASGPGSPAYAQGEAVYVQSCAGCHVAEGTGNPGVYPPLAGSEWVTGPKGRLVRILLHGVTGPILVAGEEYQGLMPGWGSVFTDAQIAALSTYVRAAWGNGASAVTPAEVTAIRNAEAGRTAFWTAPELMRIQGP